jgi:hypothetical protein
MNKDKTLYFRDELRKARAAALADAEAFSAIIVALEQLGGYLAKENKEKRGLGRLKPFLIDLAHASPLACEVSVASHGYHLPFGRLFDLVRDARNTAVHEGALARHLTEHAIELSLILEDALMNQLGKEADLTVADFMVRNPVTASSWQPLSFIRQSMLKGSFSYLPVRMSKDGPWELVSDYAITSYLRSAPAGEQRAHRLRQTLDKAVGPGPDKLRLDKPRRFGPDAAISKVLPMNGGLLVLVVDDPSSESSELLGILSPFDLL